jgi:hypothetical protein
MMTQRERPVTASPSWLAPEPCTSASTLAVSPTQIADYEATAGKVRTVAVGLSHNQPGDPAKLADVLITFVDAPNPPVRLPLGPEFESRLG